MLRTVTALACLAGAAAAAHADGFFYEETFGAAATRGDERAVLGNLLHVRLGVGFRLGNWSLEPWFGSDVTLDRRGETLGVFGGTPAPGRADLSTMGLDVKYATPRDHGLSVYLRGGPRAVSGEGALAGAAGRGLGVGTGIELVGRVRALGFLWAPLFFLHKGPFVTGALFLDAGVDAYALDTPERTTHLLTQVTTSIGFAVGTDF